MALHRTQVLLEAWQHVHLRQLADQEGISMSEMIRRMVTQGLAEGARPPHRPGLEAMAGMASDGSLHPNDIDRVLYDEMQ